MSFNLTERNRDFAVFLPSISSFYQTFISNEINDKTPIPPERVPDKFEKGVIGCNFLEEFGYFNYKWGLYSAGHAKLDIAKSNDSETMIQARDRDKTFILGDSGGFQVAKGILKFDWENFYETPQQPNYVGAADKTRQDIQNWLEHTADYSMILDVPTWSARGEGTKRTGLTSFKQCLDATMFNNDWFVRNRQGKTKYLNVLQGSDDIEAEAWYQAVKKFPFEGWAMGGNNMQDMHLLLKRLVVLRDEKLLEKGERDLIHVLGTSKLEWAVMLTALKRKLQKTVNPDLQITFDCASPFLATAYGQIYTQHVHKNSKYSYVMDKAVDDKRLAGSNIPLAWDSPIADRLTMGDLCYYAPGDLNKLGKEGATSWDSFSYFLMMAHNVYQHIDSVQRANNLADVAYKVHDVDLFEWYKARGKSGKSAEIDTWVPRNLIYFEKLVDMVFDSEKPMQLIEDNRSLLNEVSRARQHAASNTNFGDLFGDVGALPSNNDSEYAFDEDADCVLDLENSINK